MTIEELAQWVLAVEAEHEGELEVSQRVWSVFSDALEECFGRRHVRARMARAMVSLNRDHGDRDCLLRFTACFGRYDYVMDWERYGPGRGGCTRSDALVTALSGSR